VGADYGDCISYMREAVIALEWLGEGRPEEGLDHERTALYLLDIIRRLEVHAELRRHLLQPAR
jgi:hypothetical protein